MSIIETRNLAKRFGDLVAVDSLNLQIESGEVFGLLGPNGAGKSTTLLMLATLIRPTSGTATIDGFDILREPGRVRRAIGIVFQEPSSDDILTGYENLKLHAMLYSVPVREREQRIRDAFELVELTARQHDMVRTYSGGMRRRLELARGLLHEPRVLFLDEPTLGLDPQSRTRLWEHIAQLVRSRGITVVLTTHYMEEADRLCTRLAIIDDGRISALGTPAALKQSMGGDLILLRVAAPDLAAVRALPFVSRAEPGADGMLALTVTSASEHLQTLLAVVGTVERVEVRSPTLDDVFISLTGKAIREGSPEGGWAQRMMHQQRK